MGNAKGRVQPHAEQFLQNSGKQDGIAVVEQIIESATPAVPDKFLIVQTAAHNLPEGFGANGFLMDFFTKGRFAKGRQPFIRRCDVFSQRILVLAFGINSFLPELTPRFGRQRQEGAGEKRIR